MTLLKVMVINTLKMPKEASPKAILSVLLLSNNPNPAPSINLDLPQSHKLNKATLDLLISVILATSLNQSNPRLNPNLSLNLNPLKLPLMISLA